MEYYSSSGGFLHELRVLLPRYSSSRVALRPQKTTNERGRRSADCVLLFLPTSYPLPPLTPSNFSTSTSYIFSRPPLSLAFPSPTPTLPILSLSFSYSLPLVRYWFPLADSHEGKRQATRYGYLRQWEGNHRMYREYAFSKFQRFNIPAVENDPVRHFLALNGCRALCTALERCRALLYVCHV